MNWLTKNIKLDYSLPDFLFKEPTELRANRFVVKNSTPNKINELLVHSVDLERKVIKHYVTSDGKDPAVLSKANNIPILQAELVIANGEYLIEETPYETIEVSILSPQGEHVFYIDESGSIKA